MNTPESFLVFRLAVVACIRTTREYMAGRRQNFTTRDI